MRCCLSSCCYSIPSPQPEAVMEREKSYRTHVIAACALLALAFLLIGLSRLGTGLGYIPDVRMTGFSFVYHFASIHVFLVGAGLGAVGLGFALSALCKRLYLPTKLS